MIRARDRHLGVAREGGARFGDGLAVDAHVSREDERARPLAGRGKPALDEQRIETKPVLQLVRPTTQRAIAGNWPPSPASSSAAIARVMQSAARRRDSSIP